MTEEPDPNETIERLIRENRALHKTLDGMEHELNTYMDLDRMSLTGAVKYLVKHRKLLDEVKHALKRAKRKPETSHEVLHMLEALLEQTD